MSELTKAPFVAKFNDSGTGLFRSSKPIFASDDRSLVADIADSSAFFSDLLAIQISSGDGLSYTGGAYTPATSYTDTPRLWIFYCAVPNTGPVTVNIDGLGALSIKKVVNDPMTPHVELDAGDIGYGTILVCSLTDSLYFVCSATLLTSGGGSGLTDWPISSGAPTGTIFKGKRYYLTGSSGVILGEDVAEGTTMEARIANPTVRADWYFNFGGT